MFEKKKKKKKKKKMVIEVIERNNALPGEFGFGLAPWKPSLHAIMPEDY